MGERRILARRRCRARHIARGPDADRRYAHERAVRLAFGGVQPQEAALGGLADVDGARLQPLAVRVEHLVALVAAGAQDRASERERHLAVVGRLAGDGVVHACVGKIAHSLREFRGNLGRRFLLDARSQAVADDLTEQTALGPLQPHLVDFLRKTQGDARLAARLLLELRPGEAAKLARGLGRAGEDAAQARR